MADTASDGTAFDETVVFLSHFKDLPDPYGSSERRPDGTTTSSPA